MKRPVLGILLFLTLLGVSCAGHREKSAPGAVHLFNGRDLAGWSAVSAKPGTRLEDVWAVRDGVIICQGDPMGYIQSSQSYTDFKLLVEWRWAPGKPAGNSGVFLRINGEPKPLPRCIEHQLKSGDAGDLYGFHGMKITGDPARCIEIKNHEVGGDLAGVKKIVGNEKPPGEWNRLELAAEGPKLTAWVNGVKVNEATGCEVVAGPIGLQSEGGEVHFRTVLLTPRVP